MKKKTLVDKIWNAHIVEELEDGSTIFYIDQHYIHEVTSPQAFNGLRERGVGVFRPKQTLATADHNVPTVNQHLPVTEPASANQLAMLGENCKEFGIELYDLGHPLNGIVHVIGPELGMTQPGMTLVCGDSHTSTHGAFGAVAFGIGTSEVEMVLATQTLLQRRPKTMQIKIDGELSEGVGAKDLALFIINRMGTDGGTGHFVEFAGSAIENLSMEGRMTLCNMSIEMGARGGLVQADEKTISYLAATKYGASKGLAEQIRAGDFQSDPEAIFDKEIVFEAGEVPRMITWGTNPALGIPVDGDIPQPIHQDGHPNAELLAAQKYMGLSNTSRMQGLEIDYVFVGSCTNGRIEDLREFAQAVKGRQKADGVIAWIVPGSQKVKTQANEEGITAILDEAGFTLREPGCSACLAMNEDKVPAGKYCVSTSNRNFEGRQGPGARTLLASPYTAALAAIQGKIN